MNYCPVEVDADKVHRTSWPDIRRKVAGTCSIFEERLSCISADDLARTNHQRYIKDVLTVQCSVLKIGTPPIISHYNGLIVVRPGGGFSLLLPNQHVEMSRRRIRETLGPQSDRFDSVFVKL